MSRFIITKSIHVKPRYSAKDQKALQHHMDQKILFASLGQHEGRDKLYDVNKRAQHHDKSYKGIEDRAFKTALAHSGALPKSAQYYRTAFADNPAAKWKSKGKTKKAYLVDKPTKKSRKKRRKS